MFDLTPMELLIEQLGAASLIRTRSHLQPFADTPKGQLNKWAQTVNQLDLQGEIYIIKKHNDALPPLQRKYSEPNKQHKKYVRHWEYTTYTDGSKIDGKTGAGIIIYKKNKIIYRQATYSLSGKASIFQAELEAIRQAASFFNRNKIRYPAKYIKILVDSQAALKALSKYSVKSETVQRTIWVLSQLGYNIPRLTLARI